MPACCQVVFISKEFELLKFNRGGGRGEWGGGEEGGGENLSYFKYS